MKMMEIDYLHFSKKSKANYSNQYFKANMSNIKNVCRGIKFIIADKNISTDIPNSLSFNGSTVTGQVEISTVFFDYFATIAEKINKKKEQKIKQQT